ncbi:PilZ domain-containing protein [Lacrimispora saccharolytica]|uniref:Type IV pilus assembly PilZ n=1 Tax=Lacrimispora saccharolytica (strain ATCC 35040 / DSM 2544 / NRCC 2533 / WM1) TaxID=610130 RepID=D9R9X4_LACSW|nr:PilZ domain-containing protein [Lacrimispora saccharolytica]ADL05946.1 type IV pilus assembly PilZ [[Clostridium] saccharolyticum WM1]QRV19923.1 PilZ domain-containing protein [Lacrimispora saccharolytica]
MFIECEKACVYTMDGVFIAEVKVVDSHKDSMGLIFEEEDMDMVNTESVIVFYDGVQGLVTCRCRLSGRVKISGDESGEIGNAIYKVPCLVDELIGIEQRRRDLKVRISMPVTLETADADGKVTHIAAKAKDISAGGIGLEAAVELKESQVFSFLFDTDSDCTRLKASILWVKKISEENEPPRYRYGSRFFDMTTYQESMVRKFTFLEQLKRRKTQ